MLKVCHILSAKFRKVLYFNCEFWLIPESWNKLKTRKKHPYSGCFDKSLIFSLESIACDYFYFVKMQGYQVYLLDSFHYFVGSAFVSSRVGAISRFGFC